MPKFNDLTGKKFKYLTVLYKNDFKVKSRISYHCICRCVKESDVLGIYLMSGKVGSCGCLKHEAKQPFIRMRDRIFRVYQKHAESRNLDFTLSLVHFSEMLLMNCFYCGIKPNNKYKDDISGLVIDYQGVDRYNNSKGYTRDNCVPCCDTCNKAKRSMSIEEFYSWIGRLIEYNIDVANERLK